MLRSSLQHFLRRNGGWSRSAVRPCFTRLSSSSIPPSIDYYNDVDMSSGIQFGNFKLMASNSTIEREYAHVEDLGTVILPGERVWLRGRISSIRKKGNVCFAVIRSKSFFTLQVCHFRDKSDDMSKALISFTGDIPLESVVDVYGEVRAASVKSCSQKTVEIAMEKVFVVSRAPVVLPFSVEDASRFIYIYIMCACHLCQRADL
jgi:aspartyl/asparaginyl-tRNA synthetase